MRNKLAFSLAKNLGMKSDILRYEILMKYGGIYVDTDYECLKNIGRLNYSHSYFNVYILHSIYILYVCRFVPLIYSIHFFYTILSYIVLYHTIIYYTIPYYTILYHTILYYAMLYYTILYYAIP